MNTQTLLSIVADQREELLTNDYTEFCTCPEESLLDLKSNMAQVVIGVRRCGKSTLCEMFLKQKNVEFAYVNFDDNFSLENLGWKLENVVCVELMRRYKPMFCDVFYYKDTSSQVDFVVAKDGNVRELIQVSYDISNEKTRKREIRGLKNAAKQLKCNNLTLITFEDNETIEEDGLTINVIPATEWLLR